MSKVAYSKAMPPLVLPVCLLGSVRQGKVNFCTVAWFTMIDDEPPTIGLVLGKERFTKEGIMENRTFSVNIPSAGQAQATDYCGIHSGHKLDKSDVFRTSYGRVENAPLIDDCPVSLGCRLQQVVEFPGVDLVIGLVEEILVEERCIVDGKMDQRRADPLLYCMPGGPYVGVGSEIAKAFSIGKGLKRKG